MKQIKQIFLEGESTTLKTQYHVNHYVNHLISWSINNHLISLLVNQSIIVQKLTNGQWIIQFIYQSIQYQKQVVWRFSVKKVFLEMSQNSQENTCASVSFLIKFQAEAWSFFAEVVNRLQPLKFFAKGSILDGWQGSACDSGKLL